LRPPTLPSITESAHEIQSRPGSQVTYTPVCTADGIIFLPISETDQLRILNPEAYDNSGNRDYYRTEFLTRPCIVWIGDSLDGTKTRKNTSSLQFRGLYPTKICLAQACGDHRRRCYYLVARHLCSPFHPLKRIPPGHKRGTRRRQRSSRRSEMPPPSPPVVYSIATSSKLYISSVFDFASWIHSRCASFVNDGLAYE
jgi:hypothetical protein